MRTFIYYSNKNSCLENTNIHFRNMNLKILKHIHGHTVCYYFVDLSYLIRRPIDSKWHFISSLKNASLVWLRKKKIPSYHSSISWNVVKMCRFSIMNIFLLWISEHKIWTYMNYMINIIMKYQLVEISIVDLISVESYDFILNRYFLDRL